MCVLAMAWRAHPDWQLVVIANRDERHDRPTAPLARWADSDVIAGQDLESGGTWLGVSRNGRFAALTNRSGAGELSPDAPSRGLLVRDMILGKPPDHHMQMLFNPFNMFVVADDACLWTNWPQAQRQSLAPGIYSLSNGGSDEPWDKMVALETTLRGWLGAGGNDILFARLREAPDVDPATPPADWPRSAIFIRHPVYGTRCSTIVMVDAEGHGDIIERRYDVDGISIGETRLTFTWPQVTTARSA